MKVRPARMIKQLISSVFKKPATRNYPKEKSHMPAGFRGKLKFYPQKCIGCKMCMKDCPTQAISIIKTADNTFEADINLAQCIYCAQCVDSCPKKALEATSEFELAQLDSAKLKVVFHAQVDPASKKKT